MNAFTRPSDLDGTLPGSPLDDVSPLERLALAGVDHQELREDAIEAWEDHHEENPHEDHPSENLLDYVKQAFEDARSARTTACVDEMILKGRRLVKGEYSDKERGLVEEGLDVWYHLTAPLSNIALAFLRSILSGDEDNPLWELRHSPIPELPEFVVERAAEFAAERIQQEALLPDPETGVVTPMTEERAVEIAYELRGELFESLERQASLHTRNLQRQINDNLSTGDFHEAFDEFLQCLVVDPVAVFKGPVVSSKMIPEWRNGKKRFVERKYQHFEAVDVADIFPSPDSIDTQSGSFIVHLREMTRRDLVSASRLKGFVSENIDTLLHEFEYVSRDWMNPIEVEADELAHQVGKWRDYEPVKVVEYHGEIPGIVLKHYGLQSFRGKRLDPLHTYEMEVWVTCDKIIRAVEACNEGRRPFHRASLYPCKGSFWGESVPHRAENEQRSANAALRAAIRDIGFTQAPIGQIDVSFMDKNAHVPDRFTPGMLLPVNSRLRGTQGKALAMEQLTTQSGTFLNLINGFFANAELNTGISRQMLGQALPGVSTLGEANLLQNNAVTGLRSMLVPIDAVIEEVVEMVACQIMMTTNDPTLKADASPIAKGSTHLLDRQLNRANLLQLLNTIYPMSRESPGMFEPFAMGCLIREIATSFGQDPDKFVPDPNSVETRNEQLLLRQQQLGIGQQGGGGIAGGVSQPPATLSVATGQSPASAGAT